MHFMHLLLVELRDVLPSFVECCNQTSLCCRWILDISNVIAQDGPQFCNRAEVGGFGCQVHHRDHCTLTGSGAHPSCVGASIVMLEHFQIWMSLHEGYNMLVEKLRKQQGQFYSIWKFFPTPYASLFYHLGSHLFAYANIRQVLIYLTPDSVMSINFLQQKLTLIIYQYSVSSHQCQSLIMSCPS